MLEMMHAGGVDSQFDLKLEPRLFFTGKYSLD